MTPLEQTIITTGLMYLSWWVGKRVGNKDRMDIIKITTTLLINKVDQALMKSISREHLTREQAEKVAKEIERYVTSETGSIE